MTVVATSLLLLVVTALLKCTIVSSLGPYDVCWNGTNKATRCCSYTNGTETSDTDRACCFHNEAFEKVSYPAVCSNCSADGENTLVPCEFTQARCNPEGTVCYDGGLEMTQNSDQQTTKVTTCTVLNTTNLTTCVDMYPSKPGNFSLVSSCEVHLNGQLCNFCEVCPGNTTITIDCCNVADDAVQFKCQPVLGSGAYIVNFDPVPNPPGQCSGIHNFSGNLTGRNDTKTSGSVGDAFGLWISCITLIVPFLVAPWL